MTMYSVSYIASVWVEADSKDEAIDIAVAEWEEHRWGAWEAVEVSLEDKDED